MCCSQDRTSLPARDREYTLILKKKSTKTDRVLLSPQLLRRSAQEAGGYMSEDDDEEAR